MQKIRYFSYTRPLACIRKMKKIRIFTVLILIVCCKNSETKTELQNTKIEINKNLIDKSLLFPFEKKLTEFQKDSINEYGAGDCWGNVQQYSKNKIEVGLDSTNCGDYGFYHSFYLLNNGGIRIAHLKESNTILGNNTNDTKYILVEKIYDYRKKPYFLYLRTDTLNKPNIDLIRTGFIKTELKDFQTSYEHLIMGYEGAWGMKVDY